MAARPALRGKGGATTSQREQEIRYLGCRAGDFAENRIWRYNHTLLNAPAAPFNRGTAVFVERSGDMAAPSCSHSSDLVTAGPTL